MSVWWPLLSLFPECKPISLPSLSRSLSLLNYVFILLSSLLYVYPSLHICYLFSYLRHHSSCFVLSSLLTLYLSFFTFSIFITYFSFSFFLCFLFSFLRKYISFFNLSLVLIMSFLVFLCSFFCNTSSSIVCFYIFIVLCTSIFLHFYRLFYPLGSFYIFIVLSSLIFLNVYI